MERDPIYMDNQATTPVDPRVIEAMVPFLSVRYTGMRPAGIMPLGGRPKRRWTGGAARLRVWSGHDPKRLFSPAARPSRTTWRLRAWREFYADKGNHIITAVTEHKAVLDTCQALERANLAEVTYLPVDQYGRVDVDDVKEAIQDNTVLISLMYANNEIGTLHPVRAIGKLAKERGILFHCDATQGVGKVPVNVDEDGIDLMSMSAHKIYGPKGCGALYVRSRGPRVRLRAQVHGGGHERGMRSGTLNVAGIVGFGKACELCGQELEAEAGRLISLRQRLHDGLTENLEEVYLNGHPTERIPGNLNLSFSYVEGESFLMGLNREIALSSGSACTSATLEPSYVLKALGVGEELAHTSIRFGLGRFNTEEDVDYVIRRVSEVVVRLREMSPLYEMAKEGIDLKSVQWKT